MEVSDSEVEREELKEEEPWCSEAIGDLQGMNTVGITGLAMASLRCQVSNRETNAIASAYAGDVIKSGFLPLTPPSRTWTPGIYCTSWSCSAPSRPGGRSC